MTEKGLSYTVLARRFRPQSFDEVVGQEHVGQAIKNAIASGRVAHAYLFTGARGVGKTSTARIFAKALNCPYVSAGVPCNQCEVCDSIGAGNDVDVLEIDGASNRGIDDIRQLRANVNVRSMRSPNKVYIIDEVHMLTKEAFNALLKTLEEPPPNVKFVFCTTEPNKLPDTILSRCQRFDFGTIAQQSIVNRLNQIAEAEGKQVDAEAVELVARRAAGSMRDSQSLFDQLLAFGGEQITASDVHRLLGTASDDRLIELVNSLIERRASDALLLLDTALLEGVQLGSFSDQLLAYFRDLLVTAAGAETVTLSGVANSSRGILQQQAQVWGMQTVSAAMQILAETKNRMQRVNYGRALVELAIVRISMLEDLESVVALVRQVQAGQAPAVVHVQQPVRALPQATALSPVKKNEISRSNSVAESVPIEVSPIAKTLLHSEQTHVEQAVPAPVVQQNLELTAETLKSFWSRFISELPDQAATHLKNSCRQAISGPNLLQIVFPKSYLFSKSYCERPAALQKLSDVATNIAGNLIKCTFSVDESSPEKPQATPQQIKKLEPERRKPSSVDNDEFVQKAVQIFGGQVVDVRPFLKSGHPEDEDVGE